MAKSLAVVFIQVSMVKSDCPNSTRFKLVSIKSSEPSKFKASAGAMPVPSMAKTKGFSSQSSLLMFNVADFNPVEVGENVITI